MEERTKQRATHQGITCDECGEHPIQGIRFKAKYVYDYDICESCWQTHDDKDDYVSFEKQEMDSVTRRACRVDDNRIHAWSVGAAARKIRLNRDSSVACLNLFHDYGGSKQLEDALRVDSCLEIIYIHMTKLSGDSDEEESINTAIVNVARGIEDNRCIKRVFWHIDRQSRQDKSVALALRSMLENNTTIEACFVECLRYGEDVPELSAAASGLDYFTTQVFGGLKANKNITRFRLYGYRDLSEETKRVVLDCVEGNACLCNVNTDFGTSDPRLDLILACRHENWIGRLGDTDMPKASRVEVLLEALDHMKVAPVATAYHLLRSNPDLLT